MNKITLLPHWCLTGGKQAFYDTESGDSIEQTARVYAAMRNLQEEYNKMVDELNKTITDFMKSTTKNYEEFEEHINKIFHDYIIKIDTKIAHQDRVIADAVNYMKTNLSTSITDLINEMRETGELTEDILNAFEDFTIRLKTLEDYDLNTRLETLENKNTYFSYNDLTQELELHINEEGETE